MWKGSVGPARVRRTATRSPWCRSHRRRKDLSVFRTNGTQQCQRGAIDYEIAVAQERCRHEEWSNYATPVARRLSDVLDVFRRARRAISPRRTIRRYQGRAWFQLRRRGAQFQRFFKNTLLA
jgi:hypothetical protein